MVDEQSRHQDNDIIEISAEDLEPEGFEEVQPAAGEDILVIDHEDLAERFSLPLAKIYWSLTTRTSLRSVKPLAQGLRCIRR